jgi:hypothetical protein
MVYGEETPEHTEKFKAEKLPNAGIVPEEWEVMGVTRAAPRTDPLRDTGPGGAGSTGAGTVTGGYHIAPRHRKIVRTYYDKKGIRER